MLNKDYNIARNDNIYTDNKAKVFYLFEKGFRVWEQSPDLLIKNDLAISPNALYNYNLEKLDLIDFLADNWYVHDPIFVKGYYSEYCELTYELFHQLEPEEIKYIHKENLEHFKAHTTFN